MFPIQESCKLLVCPGLPNPSYSVLPNLLFQVIDKSGFASLLHNYLLYSLNISIMAETRKLKQIKIFLRLWLRVPKLFVTVYWWYTMSLQLWCNMIEISCSLSAISIDFPFIKSMSISKKPSNIYKLQLRYKLYRFVEIEIIVQEKPKAVVHISSWCSQMYNDLENRFWFGAIFSWKTSSVTKPWSIIEAFKNVSWWHNVLTELILSPKHGAPQKNQVQTGTFLQSGRLSFKTTF